MNRFVASVALLIGMTFVDGPHRDVTVTILFAAQCLLLGTTPTRPAPTAPAREVAA